MVPAFGACVASTLLVDWMVDVEAGATAEAELAVTDAEGGPAVLVAFAAPVTEGAAEPVVVVAACDDSLPALPTQADSRTATLNPHADTTKCRRGSKRLLTGYCAIAFPFHICRGVEPHKVGPPLL